MVNECVLGVINYSAPKSITIEEGKKQKKQEGRLLKIHLDLGNKTVEGINVNRIPTTSCHKIIMTTLKWDKPSNMRVHSQRILRGLFSTYL